MKKFIFIMLIAALLCPFALAEDALPEEAATEEAVPEVPAFDEPALSNPEARYEQYLEASDGSEAVLFALLDAANDEAADIAAGALHIVETPLDADGAPVIQLDYYIQDSFYGTMLITHILDGENEVTAYSVGEVTCMVENTSISIGQLYEQADFDYFIESYHFPYAPLRALNGTRQDENGYTYLLASSDEGTSLEFVVSPDDMRVAQLRLYMRDDDGALRLVSLDSYEACEPFEVPDQIVEILADYVEPVPTEAPEDDEAESVE